MKYYLSLGGNIGDSHAILRGALDGINRQAGQVEQVSSFYTTAPWGFSARQDFVNAAAVVESALSPQEMLEKLMGIEKNFGRQRDADAKGYASRTLDIDIIFAGSEVLDTPSLKIPHPLAHLRRFVLEPMAEIAPDFIHPVLEKTTQRLLEECPPDK